MKVAILTQPLISNYGGILQNYALQQVLLSLEHEPITLDRQRYEAKWKKTLKLVFRELGIVRYKNHFTDKEFGIYFKDVSNFIDNNINIKRKVTSEQALQKIFKVQQFDAVIVGSDQVWRPMYSPNIYNYFLDFLQDEQLIKIGYSASFGTDKWEFSAEQTQICANLAQQFDAISVRESSAIEQCKSYLKIESRLTLDPTLLLDCEHYKNLAKTTEPSEGNLFCYILDNSQDIQNIITDFAKEKKLKPFYISHLPTEDKSVVPKVEQWLRGFLDAEFVITDSFHGTAFSIIFNKPFISIGNKERGLARFDSILEVFNLKSRLLDSKTSSEEFCQIAEKAIDYELVNANLKIEKEKSMSYLESNLSA